MLRALPKKLQKKSPVPKPTKAAGKKRRGTSRRSWTNLDASPGSPAKRVSAEKAAKGPAAAWMDRTSATIIAFEICGCFAASDVKTQGCLRVLCRRPSGGAWRRQRATGSMRGAVAAPASSNDTLLLIATDRRFDVARRKHSLRRKNTSRGGQCEKKRGA